MEHVTQSSTNPGSHGVGKMLERVKAGLEQGLIPVEVFGDQQIFDAEMERIFGHSWIFVAFESEIPKAGDFVVRRVGTDSVIVTRSSDGKVNVLANFCRHRGAQICASDRGNASHFRCPYHGWVYKNTGEWRGTPDKSNSYRNFDYKDWGLLRAPLVDTCYGMIFTCLDPHAPPLADYLGGGGWMMKVIMDLHPDGMSVIGPPDRYRVRCNWKTASENFAGDSYHIAVAHRSVEKVNLGQGFDHVNEIATNYVLDNGHSFIGSSMGAVMGEAGELWGYENGIRSRFDLSRLDEAQQQTARHCPPAVGNIFPNFGFIRFFNLPSPGKAPVVYTSWRQFYPISPTETELVSWQLKWNFMSEQQAAESYSAGQFSFSSAGIFEQDDTIMWEGASRVSQSPWARRAGLMFNVQLGMENLGGAQRRDPSWRGPGEAYRPGPGEPSIRAFYEQWLSEMLRRE